MTAAKQLPLMSVEEYLEGELHSEVKHEYCGGYVYAMAGARTGHNRIATAWNAAMHSRLRGQPCEPFGSDMKVRIEGQPRPRFYYPDGMVVCDANDPQQVYQDRPVILVEVLSEATRRTDQGEKREAYLTIPTLQNYLLIETSAPLVVVYRRTDQEFDRQVYEGLEAVIPLPVIHAELPLAELYERVEFLEATSDQES